MPYELPGERCNSIHEHTLINRHHLADVVRIAKYKVSQP